MQVFKSKKDWWLIAFLVCMTGLLVQLLLTMYAKGTMQQYPLHTAVYLLTVLVIWWPVWSTRYTIHDQKTLEIRSMWMRWSIPLQDIQHIVATDHSIVAPALSLKRLKISYQKQDKTDFILISPKKPSAFLQAIQDSKNST